MAGKISKSCSLASTAPWSFRWPRLQLIQVCHSVSHSSLSSTFDHCDRHQLVRTWLTGCLRSQGASRGRAGAWSLGRTKWTWELNDRAWSVRSTDPSNGHQWPGLLLVSFNVRTSARCCTRGRYTKTGKANFHVEHLSGPKRFSSYSSEARSSIYAFQSDDWCIQRLSSEVPWLTVEFKSTSLRTYACSSYCQGSFCPSRQTRLLQ